MGITTKQMRDWVENPLTKHYLNQLRESSDAYINIRANQLIGASNGQPPSPEIISYRIHENLGVGQGLEAAYNLAFTIQGEEEEEDGESQ